MLPLRSSSARVTTSRSWHLHTPESHQSSLINRSELGSQSVSNSDKGSQLVGLGSDQNGEFDAYDCIAFDKVFCIYKAPAPFDPRKIFHSKQQNYVLFSGKFLLGKSSWINHLTFYKIGLPPPPRPTPVTPFPTKF